jgi:CO/xanthine dehydrogenase FAD-binding subunit
MGVHVATSLADALAAMATDPAAHVLAGGTDLMVQVNFGHRSPSAVIAIDRVPELRGWRRIVGPVGTGGALRLGAGLTYRDMLAPDLAALLPALAEAARTVGSPQIRNAGTLGGNLGTCSPAGDALPVLAALDATIELASATTRREISLHDFMVGVKRTALAPGELVVAATVPLLEGYQGFAKVGVRNAMVISVTSACLAVDRPGRTVRLALGAVAPTVVRARQAEAWVAGELAWDGTAPPAAVAEEFGRRAAAEARPIDDHRSTAGYRRHAVSVLAARLLGRAAP